MKDNLPSILEKGLLPKTPNEVPNAKKGVYLSLHPFEWMHWATDESQCAGALIEIDVTGLELIKSTAFAHNDKIIPEYICNKPIPVEKFIKISISTNKNPCSFEEFNFEKGE